MDVADVEGGTVTGQAAGAQGGQTALVGQLSQRVGLIHELRQRAGAEELLDGGGDRPDVDEGLGGDHVQVLGGHTLPDDTLHAGEADAELVLNQLAHAAQTAVAQMVDVIRGAHAVSQTVEVVDGGHDVLPGDMLGDQVVQMLPDGVLQLLAAELVQQLAQGGEEHHLRDPALLRVEVHEVLHVHHVVGEGAHLLAVHVQNDLVDAAVIQLPGALPGQVLAGLGDDLAGAGIRHRHSQGMAGQTGPKGHLLVELIAADCGQVIAAGVVEGGVEQALGGVHRGRLTGTQLAVDLQQGLLIGFTGVLLQGGNDALVLAEHLQDLRVGLGADGADQAGDGQLAVLVDADIEDVGQVGLVLQPGAPVGDDGGAVGVVVRLVPGVGKVHTGRTGDLRDDHALGPVDDEGAGLSHDGEIPHEDLLLLDLLRLLVAQAHLHLDGGGVGGVPGLALLHVVLGLLVHGVVDEGQLQVAGVVRNGVHILEHLTQPGVQEPLIGFLLDLQQVGHIQDLLVAGKAFAQGLAVVHVLDHSKNQLAFFFTKRVDSLIFRSVRGENRPFLC